MLIVAETPAVPSTTQALYILDRTVALAPAHRVLQCELRKAYSMTLQRTNNISLRSGLSATPTADEVAALARKLWEARGCPEGSPEQDWYEAERQSKRQTFCGAPDRGDARDPDNGRGLHLWAVIRGIAVGVGHFSSHGGLVPIGLVFLAFFRLIQFRRQPS